MYVFTFNTKNICDFDKTSPILKHHSLEFSIGSLVAMNIFLANLFEGK